MESLIAFKRAGADGGLDLFRAEGRGEDQERASSGFLDSSFAPSVIGHGRHGKRLDVRTEFVAGSRQKVPAI